MSSAMNHKKRSHRSETLKAGAFRASSVRAYNATPKYNKSRNLATTFRKLISRVIGGNETARKEVAE